MRNVGIPSEVAQVPLLKCGGCTRSLSRTGCVMVAHSMQATKAPSGQHGGQATEGRKRQAADAKGSTAAQFSMVSEFGTLLQQPFVCATQRPVPQRRKAVECAC